MILHEYFRSTSSFRTRIALNIKNIPYEHRSVHLRKNGGEQFSPAYREINPQQLVPTLVDGETVVTQSLAIIEYLDECYPDPALLPTSPADRARVRAFAQVAACEMHPLHNLRVLQYLGDPLKQSQKDVDAWVHHWLQLGFDTLEGMLARVPKNEFAYGPLPGLADICLVPQVFTAHRFGFRLDTYPNCMRVHEHCMKLPAFDQAQPGKQPDSEV